MTSGRIRGSKNIYTMKVIANSDSMKLYVQLKVMLNKVSTTTKNAKLGFRPLTCLFYLLSSFTPLRLKYDRRRAFQGEGWIVGDQMFVGA